MMAEPKKQFGPVLVPQAVPAIQWRYCDRIEPGEYSARSRSAKIYLDCYFRRWVCAVQFDILNNSLIDVIARLTWYLNLGSEDRPRAGRRCKYWKAWTMANGGPPKRGDRLSPQVFAGRYAVVVVDDTQHDFEQVTNPQSAYSVVREVLEWQTGA